MGYFILFNPNSNPHVAVDYHGRAEEYAEHEDAVKEAEACRDDDHYLTYIVLRDEHEV